MSAPFAIRACVSGDLAAVVSVFQRSVREVACRDYAPEQIAAWAPETPDFDAWAARLASGGVFLAEQAAGIIGFVRIDAEGCVDLLFVHPAFQRQGVARALCEAATIWARARALPRLTAAVSLTARPFFEAMGFRVIRAQTPVLRGVSFRNFLMAYDLVLAPVPAR